MSKLQLFRLFVNERLTAAALEIFVAVEKTVTEYQEENDRLRRMLSGRIMPDPTRIESQTHSLTFSEVDVTPDQQVYSPHLSTINPENTRIKEEHEELRTSEAEEQFEDLVNNVVQFQYTPSCVKGECDPKDALQFLTLPQTQTLENRESYSKSVDFNPFGTVTHLKGLDFSHDHSEILNKATVCSSLVTRDPLQIHKNHGGKPSVCPFCGKAFKQKNHLSRHLIIHTGKKPFSCSNCEKSFNRKETLTRHKLIHTGEKLFSCNDCGRKFNRMKRLTLHILTHKGEKPFSCGDCGKSFYSKQTLTRHNMTHTGEKPFTCGDCGRSFSRKEHLTGHTFAFH